SISDGGDAVLALRRRRVEPLRHFLGKVDRRRVPQQRALAAEDGPQVLLGRDLADHREDPGGEGAPQLLLRVLHLGLYILIEPLEIELGALELALQAR